LKTEVIPFQNGEKIRKNYFSNGGYEKTYIDKNGKTKKWRSFDENGTLLIEIIYDDYGGEIIHLPDWSVESLKEKGLYIEHLQNKSLSDEPDDVKIESQIQQNRKEQSPDFSTSAIANPGAYYDTETNPILYRIEYVNGKEVKIYARHTLGSKHDDNYLLTYGDISSYQGTSSKNVALPYRWEDVSYGTKVEVRNLQNNKKLILYRNDFGPNQIPNTDLVYRIMDISYNYMKELSGQENNLVYGRTWLQVKQFFN